MWVALSILDLIIPKSLRKITTTCGIENFWTQVKRVLRTPSLGNLEWLFARYPYFILNNLFIYQYLMIIISGDANCTLWCLFISWHEKNRVNLPPSFFVFYQNFKFFALVLADKSCRYWWIWVILILYFLFNNIKLFYLDIVNCQFGLGFGMPILRWLMVLFTAYFAENIV